jgi:hypothetical protein
MSILLCSYTLAPRLFQFKKPLCQFSFWLLGYFKNSNNKSRMSKADSKSAGIRMNSSDGLSAEIFGFLQQYSADFWCSLRRWKGARNFLWNPPRSDLNAFRSRGLINEVQSKINNLKLYYVVPWLTSGLFQPFSCMTIQNLGRQTVPIKNVVWLVFGLRVVKGNSLQKPLFQLIISYSIFWG